MTDPGAKRSSKLLVLDTNVILHDSSCINNFEEHDVVIPITVIEELDRFKKGNDDVNFHARNFLRRLDEITGDMLSTDGESLGPGPGIDPRGDQRPDGRGAAGGVLPGRARPSHSQHRALAAEARARAAA